MTLDRTQAPQCVIQPIGLNNGCDSNRLVICFSFAEVLKQLCPAIIARAVFAYLI
jgi:hypothetical protein